MSKVIDRFPNYISSSITQSAANTFTTQTLAMPIPRITSGARSATIMEFLYIDLSQDNFDLVATGDRVQFGITVGSPPTAVNALDHSQVICHFDRTVEGPTDVGLIPWTFPYRIDLQDKNGYGFLVAADNINISMTSTGQAAACRTFFRIYYRFVTIPISEYVGIVSSLMT